MTSLSELQFIHFLVSSASRSLVFERSRGGGQAWSGAPGAWNKTNPFWRNHTALQWSAPWMDGAEMKAAEHELRRVAFLKIKVWTDKHSDFSEGW